MSQSTSMSTENALRLLSISQAADFAADQHDARLTESRHLQLANALQSSLSIEEILSIFRREVLDIVPHDNLGYENARERVSCTVGQVMGCHRISYQLVLRENALGELVFSRGLPFTEQDTQLLERLICALIYPLRNALLYKRALDTAHTDPVTGANNRAALDAALVGEVDLAHRHGVPLGLIMLDIDHFKAVNDQFGHLCGDVVLKDLIGCVVNDCIRRSDVVYRYGGEEFVLLLRNTGLDGARLLAERIRSVVEERVFLPDGQAIRITVSLGLACVRPGESASAFLGRVDRALYQAKESGRNRVVAALG
jgi:diguanylate cyclase (GGDEF)-like protein